MVQFVPVDTAWGAKAMKLLIAIAVIAVIAVIGSRITFYKRHHKPLLGNIILTGTEYILLGVVLGKMGFELLDSSLLKQLEPLSLFALCWIGCLFGMQIEVRQLRRLPEHYFSIAATQSFVTFLFVSVAAFFTLNAVVALDSGVRLAIAVVLGSVACCSAQSVLSIVARNREFENQNLLILLRYISSLDGLFAMFLFSLAMCLFAGMTAQGFDPFASAKWLFFSVLSGVLPSLILIAISRSKFGHQEFLLFWVGTVIFCAGLAHTGGHSPLLAGLVCGIVVTNFCRHRHRALVLVMQAEKAIYIFLLLLIGAIWQFRFQTGLIVLVALYFISRIAGKVAGTFIATQRFSLPHTVPPHLGLGLVSEGGLAIAMVLSFRIAHPQPLSDDLVTMIIFGVLLSELAGPGLVQNVFATREKRRSN
jgi:hypothetical protein